LLAVFRWRTCSGLFRRRVHSTAGKQRHAQQNAKYKSEISHKALPLYLSFNKITIFSKSIQQKTFVVKKKQPLPTGKGCPCASKGRI
jgi:hypothetical protein